MLIGLVVAGAIAAPGVTGGCGSLFAILVPGLLVLALLPWAYERKYFSELSFQLAFVWIAFAVAYGMMHDTAQFWRYGGPVWRSMQSSRV